MQSRPENDPHRSSWESGFFLTWSDGNEWTVRRTMLCTSEVQRSHAPSAHGKGFESLRDFLNMLFRTSSDTPERHT